MSWNQEHVRTGKVTPQRSSPRSFFRLPAFYAKAMFEPKPQTFARASKYANWRLVWFQLLLLIIIPVVIGVLKALFRDTSSGVNTHSNLLFGLLDVVTVGATFGAFIIKLISIPVLFFVGLTIQYVVARILGGQGRYVAHGFSLQLYQIPLALIGGIIIVLISASHFSTLFFAPIVSLIFFVYGIFINVSAVQGVHRISRPRAVTAVLIPYILGALALWAAIVALAHFLTNTVPALH